MNIFDVNPREPMYQAVTRLYQGYVPVHQEDAEVLLAHIEADLPRDLQPEELKALERVAGRKLGKTPPPKGLQLPKPTKATPGQLARKVNLTAGEERREKVAAMLKADPSLSNTAIAAALHVSRNTVAAVRKQLSK